MVLCLIFASVLLRADWTRRQNRLLATICLLDAMSTAGLVVAGGTVTDGIAMNVCRVLGVLIVHHILELTYAFPRGLRPPKMVRLLGVTGTAVALLLTLLPATRLWFSRFSAWLFFGPYFVATVLVSLKNLREVRGLPEARGAWVVLAAVLFRYACELSAFMIVRPLFPALFPSVYVFNRAVPVLVSLIVGTRAVLAHRLFRVRGLLAQGALYALMAVAILALVGVAVDGLLQFVTNAAVLRVSLVVVALVPLAAVSVIWRMAGRIERTILAAVDPVREQRRLVLERAVREAAALVDPERTAALTTAALAELTGGTVRFLKVAEPAGPEAPAAAGGAPDALPGPLAGQLADRALLFLHRAELAQAPPEVGAAAAALAAELIVPVRTGDELLGALLVSGGFPDRDGVKTAVALPATLAGKRAQCALFDRTFQLQRELEETRRLAALGSFAAAIAHDIRTPLTSVQLNVQMLRAKVQLPPDDMECFDIALDELRRMNRHISEILDFAKPVQLRPSEVDIHQVVAAAARRVAPILDKRNLTLKTEHVGVDVPGGRAEPARDSEPLMGDPERLQQVLVNLLDNAADASRAGGTIYVRTRAGARGVTIEVTDEGRGIAREHLEKIFEPFFTTRSDGTGLGLAIVSKVVRAHGGEIEVQSDPARGTTFTVLLPSAPPAVAAA